MFLVRCFCYYLNPFIFWEIIRTLTFLYLERRLSFPFCRGKSNCRQMEIPLFIFHILTYFIFTLVHIFNKRKSMPSFLNLLTDYFFYILFCYFHIYSLNFLGVIILLYLLNWKTKMWIYFIFKLKIFTLKYFNLIKLLYIPIIFYLNIFQLH